MFKIINNLDPFFEDNYRRIHVREYAKIQNISPPTSSRLLEDLHKQKLLKKEVDRQYFYYFANKDSELFIDLQRIYFKNKLKETGLIDYILGETLNPVIILFGSLAKAETNKDSDIDLAIFTTTNKELKVTKFEKKLKREIQIITYKRIEDIPGELKKNILNGFTIEGSW